MALAALLSGAAGGALPVVMLVFALIAADERCFDLNITAHQVVDGRADILRLQPVQQILVGDQRMLDDLRHAFAENSVGQGGKGVRVADDKSGLVERAGEVFACFEVHGRLAADG